MDLLAVVFGVLLMAWSAPVLWFGWSSARWPTADGEVVLSTVHERPGKGGRTVYVPEVRYRYVVGAKSFSGRRRRFGTFLGVFGSASAAYDALAGLTPGSRAPVFYHPRFPGLAVVRPGYATESLLPLTIGALLVLYGVLE